MNEKRKLPENYKTKDINPHPAVIVLWTVSIIVILYLLSQSISLRTTDITDIVDPNELVRREQKQYDRAYERGIRVGLNTLGVMFYAQSAIDSSTNMKNPTFYYDVLKKHNKEDDDKFISFRFRDGVLGHLPKRMLGLEDKKGDPDE